MHIIKFVYKFNLSRILLFSWHRRKVFVMLSQFILYLRPMNVKSFMARLLLSLYKTHINLDKVVSRKQLVTSEFCERVGPVLLKFVVLQMMVLKEKTMWTAECRQIWS